MKKRILSLFLAVVMLALAVPAMALTAFAAGTGVAYETHFSEMDIPASLAGTYAAGDTVTLKDGWEIGMMYPDVWNKNYIAANKAQSNYVNNGAGGGFQSWGGGGYYDGTVAATYGGRTLIFAATYGSGTDVRPFSSVNYNIVVRYTAERTGTATIDVSKLTFRLSWNCAFAILHNGNPIGQFDTDDFVYGAAADDATFNPADNGWFQAGTTSDVASQIQTITDLEVKEGDTIDFVFASTRQDSSTADYAYSRMAAQTWDFGISYAAKEGEEVQQATMTSTLNGRYAAYNATTYGWESEVLRFFQWYDANGNEINAGGALSAGCYAKLNPEMVQLAKIDLTNDTYAEAYNKYLALLQTENVLTMYDSNWSVGHLTTGSKFIEIKYPVTHVGLNLGLVTSSGTVGYANNPTVYDRTNANAGTGIAFFTTKDIFDIAYNELKSDFAAYVTDETVKAGTVQVAYADTMKSAAVAGIRLGHTNIPMGLFQTDTRGGVSWGDAAYRYTAPKNGTVTFTVDAFDAAWGGNTTWNIAVNGVRQGTETTFNWQTATELDAYKAAVAAMSFNVSAGDTIEFLYAEGTTSSSNGGFRPTITANLVYDPTDWTVEGQLTIDSNYTVNAIVSPSNPNGVMSAVVDGETVAGVKQADGSYKIPLKKNIFITALSSTVVSYALQETIDGDTFTGATRTMDANVLLSKYEAHEDETVARLAQDIRQLADYANFKLGNASEPSAAARTDMKRNDEALAALPHNYTFGGQAGAFKFVGANVNMDHAMSLILLIDEASADANIWDLKDAANGYAVKVYDNGVPLDVVTSEFAGVTVGGVDYIGVKVEIPVAYWSRALSFVLEQDGVAVSHTLDYSIHTWCSYVYNTKGGVGRYSDAYIARGVYNLGQSAAAYQASL